MSGGVLEGSGGSLPTVDGQGSLLTIEGSATEGPTPGGPTTGYITETGAFYVTETGDFYVQAN